MQKFTVFTIILSLSVLFLLGDLVFNNYLKTSTLEPLPTEQTIPYLTDESLAGLSPEELAAIEEEPLPIEIEEEEPIVVVETQLEVEPKVEVKRLTESSYVQAGFTEPVLKTTIFSGQVFGFIPFSDQTQANIYQWNLFDGESYVGSIYEFRYDSETGALQGYLNLRDRAQGMPDAGTLNEVNLYGEASFYFNHLIKTRTVHKVIRTGNSVFAFEYAFTHHEKMKKLFDLL